MENGVRKFATYKNTYEVFTVSSLEAANPDNISRSPFANYMVQLTDSSYRKCDIISTEMIEKCKYEQRTKVVDLVFIFEIEFTPDFPDISCRDK